MGLLEAGIRVIKDRGLFQKEEVERFSLKKAQSFNSVEQTGAVIKRIDDILGDVDKNGECGDAFVFKVVTSRRWGRERFVKSLTIDTTNSGEVTFLRRVRNILGGFVDEYGNPREIERYDERIIRFRDWLTIVQSQEEYDKN